MPAGDYSLVRTLTTPPSGVWSEPMAASFDYRYFATIDVSTGAASSARVSSGNVLFQPSPVIDGPLNVNTAKNRNLTSTDYRYYASRNAADIPAGRPNYPFIAR